MLNAPPSIVKCGKQLHMFDPNKHSQYEEVNDLISNVKKIFLKAPLRVQAFRDTLPGCPLSPQPVLTRWGTWLQAEIYYCDYSKDIKKVVMQFDPTVAQGIAKFQQLFQLPKVKINLSYIKAHFSILPSSITKLESAGSQLNESIGVIQTIYTSLENTPGIVGNIALHKLKELLSKNVGYQTLTSINDVLLCGNITNTLEFLSSKEICDLEYVPLTSCDVERSFSRYKEVLTDKRQSFSAEHLETFNFIC